MTINCLNMTILGVHIYEPSVTVTIPLYIHRFCPSPRFALYLHVLPIHLRYDLTELDEDSKHYYYFRSLPKVRRQ